MKKAFALTLFTLLSFVGFAQQNAPTIAFAEKSHEFGTIDQGEVVEHVFAFTNTGAAPLVLTNVNTTCGCTAPEWPREPIAPGETSKITVRFNSRGKQGHQNKVITIISNASNSTERISMVGDVAVPVTD